jgi:uncharacterized membrane protein YgdD (TMEM256/DUF423 family)
MDRLFFSMGAMSALIGVAAGAFGAHALKGRLSGELLVAFETGARYQMYHALGLFAVAAARAHWRGGALTAAGWLFVAGTLVFSGSLYWLALTEQRGLGAVTPIGGAAFLLGWLALAVGVLRAA